MEARNSKNVTDQFAVAEGNSNFLITQLNRFNLFEGKLFYACGDFVGYDPVISRELSIKRAPGDGTSTNVVDFEMNGEQFTAVLSNTLYYGPIRGCRKIVISRNGSELVREEARSMGFGSNYSSGKRFFAENGRAYLLDRGCTAYDYRTRSIAYDLNNEDYYLFRFDNIAIPAGYQLPQLSGILTVMGKGRRRGLKTGGIRLLRTSKRMRLKNHAGR